MTTREDVFGDDLKAPFPWFGGKRRVADLVWAALGAVDNYVEPFFGSGAVLLGRPDDTFPVRRDGEYGGFAETVNDADAYLSNFWRALAADPDAVAAHADWPVNETDLFARHLWLVDEGRRRIERMESDPDFYDAKVAGWWVWGINSWIGSGWCSGRGAWAVVDGKVEKTGGKGGQWRQLPHLGDAGQGVNRQLPHLGNAGRGVNRQLPHLGDAGRGVNRKRPHLGNRGSDKPGREGDGEALAAYFRALTARLRRVRVCCGDWTRVVTPGATAFGNVVGVFLDPPYLGDVRTRDLYRVDDHTISHAVRDWCLANADNPRYRIVLAGYAEEHDALLPDTWRRHRYSANAAYQTNAGGGVNAANRHNECLWLSPHCLGGETADAPLFSQEDADA
jgi:site-specific DNA-adenine methylase